MKPIVFVSPPFAGHFNPLFELADATRNAGYEIEFITGRRKHAILRQRGVRAVALESISEDALEAIANTSEPVESNPLKLAAQLRESLSLLHAIGCELEKLWSANRPSLVVADSVAPIAGLVAERLQIPWITTIVTPFAMESARGTPSYCGGWSPAHGMGGRIRDAIGRVAVKGFKNAMGLLFREDLRRLGLRSVYRQDGSEAVYSPHAILGLGIRELDFDRDWPPQFKMIGPVVASPVRPPIEFTSGRPRVLVTLGTHLLWAKRTLVDQVCALADALPDVNFVVSFGDPEAAVCAGTKGVQVVPFVAYEDRNLEQFDAVIHHGGAGIAYAAILAGLPSLVVPHDYDQFDFAARFVHHRLGLRARSIAGSAAEMRRVLDRSQWPALAGFREKARAYEPAKAFVETVKRFSQAL